MKKTYLIQFLILILLFVSNLTFAQNRNYVPGEILVKLKANTNVKQWAKKRQHFRGQNTQLRLRKKVSNPLNIYAFKFNHNTIDEKEMLEMIRDDRDVDIAQFNHYVKMRTTTPNDPQYNQQWQYNNTGQSGGTVGADIDADLAWDVTTGGVTPQGDTIVVCIIDGGFEITHPDLAPNIWYNKAEIPNNGIDDDNNGFIDDVRGWNTGTNDDDVTNNTDHGTSVAGIVGAKGNNGIGVAGVNWNVKLMLVSGGSGIESEVITAYSYPLIARKKYNETNGAEGAFVVATNASWGLDGGQASEAPLWCAFYDSLGTAGILNAGATVNDNQNVDTFGDLPTACPSDYLIAVTNMDHNDTKVEFAGYGAVNIDIGAFGEGTWTIASGNSYAPFGGTSGATPHVTGTIALLYAAPCNNLISLAKSNPSAAALLVKEYILNGGDDNASLQGITVTGKPCPSPSGLTATNITDVQASLSWTSNSNTTSDTLWWRAVDASSWTKVVNATSPIVINNLTACTNYEFKVKSQCDTINSDTSKIATFKTDGCCENPTDFTVAGIMDTAATANWNSVLAAQSYNIRFREVGTTNWTTENTTATTFDFSGLTECTMYEVQIQTVCAAQNIEYGSSVNFQTLGCGACIDLPYCAVPALESNEEWIESVVFNTINNTSGNNNGYGDFTGILSTDLTKDSTVELTVTPDYSGDSYAENLKVWIDFNGDGDFEDAGEEVFKAIGITTDTSSMVTIPNDAIIGLTRMRIILSFGSIDNPCSVSEYAFGEVEDYCINIIDGTVPCNTPTGLDTTMVGLTSANLSWTNEANATGYLVRYKTAVDTGWTETMAATDSISLVDLEKCTNYEVQVKTICNNGQSDYSNSLAFKTDCSMSTNDLSDAFKELNIIPNPFYETVNVGFSFRNQQNGVVVELLNHFGQTIQSKALKQLSGDYQNIQFDGRNLEAGLYIVRIKTVNGKSIARKLLKVNR